MLNVDHNLHHPLAINADMLTSLKQPKAQGKIFVMTLI